MAVDSSVDPASNEGIQAAVEAGVKSALATLPADIAAAMQRTLGQGAAFGASDHDRQASRSALGYNPLAGATTVQTLMYAARGPSEAMSTASNALADRIKRGPKQSSAPPVGTTTGGGQSPRQGESGPPAGGTSLDSAGGGGGPRHAKETRTTSGGGGGGVMRSAVSQAVRDVGGAASGGGGIMGMISALPGVGMIGDLIGGFADQRDQNAKFQNMTGGTNLSGVGQRYNQAVYAASTMGMFSSDEANQAYSNATSLGLADNSGAFQQGATTQDRKAALDYMYEMKSSRGQGVDESTQQLQLATQSATVSFSGLATVLEKVAATAGQAGVNADTATQNFMNMMQAGMNSGMSGAAAMTGAQQGSSYQASLGRTYQGVNMTGRQGTNYQYMVASQNGQTLNQYQSDQALNPVKAAQERGVSDKIALNTWLTPAISAWIQKQVASVGGRDVLIKDPSIADGWWALFQGDSQFANVDPNAMVSVVEGLTGQSNMTAEQCFAYIVQQVIGNTEAAQVTASAKAMQVTSGYKAPTATSGVSTGGNPGGNRYGALGTSGSGTDAAYSGSSQAGRSLEASLKTANQMDPNMEAVIAKLGDKADSTSVIVQTANGKRKVNLAVAMDKYRDELASGAAVFSQDSGDGLAGQNITAAGGTLDTSRAKGVNAEIAAPGGGQLGVAATGADVTATAQAAGQNAQLGTIGLTHEASLYFKMNYNDPNATGVPGSPSSSTNPSLRATTGNPLFGS